jgi:hypothetical protein
MMTRCSRSTSAQRSPAASPRRSPRRAIGHHIAKQAVLGDAVEEGGQLPGGPYRHRRAHSTALPGLDPVVGPHLRLRPARGGQLDEPGRIVAQQPVADRGVERRAQRRADAVQGRRGGWATVAGIGARQPGEHRRDLVAGQLTEPNAAQVRG